MKGRYQVNIKQKFGYTILGGVIGIAGMVLGMSYSPLTAENSDFGDITCTSLNVLDAQGMPRVLVYVDESGGYVGVLAREGKAGAAMGVHPKNGGLVAVNDNDANPGAIMTNGKLGGLVSVFSKDRTSGAMMSISQVDGKISGRVDISSNEGRRVLD